MTFADIGRIGLVMVGCSAGKKTTHIFYSNSTVTLILHHYYNVIEMCVSDLSIPGHRFLRSTS